uniref:Claudin n=1 Tax=Scophthalmus maximus TaxID=52904 RepID=A0A8D2ZGT3_SCOMX
MASLGLQILGIGLAVLGWIGNILICMLPLWKVSAFIGNNIVVAQTIWEGLWMTCVVQSTGQMQCKVYDSLLALPPDLQAARAMVVIAILFSLFGLLLSVVGGKCTTCVGDKAAKARVAISAGVFFLLSGALSPLGLVQISKCCLYLEKQSYIYFYYDTLNVLEIYTYT